MDDRLREVLEGRAQPLDVAVLADDASGQDYPYVIKEDGSLAADPAAFILDKYGAALSWRRAEVHPDGKYIFRLVGFKETSGPALMLTFCVDRETQEPLVGKAAIRWWPGAEPLGDIPPPASKWFDIGIVAYIKANGAADWAIGQGEAYYPTTESGVCKTWIASLDGPSDLVENWGYLKGTPYRHLAPIFERVLAEDDGPVDPEPVDGDLEAVVAAINALTEAVKAPRTIA